MLTSLRMLVLMMVITGFLCTATLTFLAQAFFPVTANGSLVTNAQGQVVGSQLIAQKFVDAKYFWARPSAVDYNPQPSGGSQFSLSNKAFRDAMTQRRSDGQEGSLLFTSGSGLDPHIFVADALAQMERIARARHLNEIQMQRLMTLVMESHEPRKFGLLGEERINVLMLNLKMDELFK